MPFRKTAVPANSSRAILRLLALFGAVVLLMASAVTYSVMSGGFSTHDEPSRIEALLAKTIRRWAASDEVRKRLNPVPSTPEGIERALTHYADHCATCHGSDGSGATAIGRNLYPRVPDMRMAPTQSLTDGELFWIVEHGIRLTGMPGWGNGTAEGEHDSWELVHLIRRLPMLTADQVQYVDAHVPKTPSQLKREEEERRFLAGEDSRPTAAHGGER